MELSLACSFHYVLRSICAWRKDWVKRLVYLRVYLSILPVEFVLVWIKILEVFSNTKCYFFAFVCCAVLLFSKKCSQSLLEIIWWVLFLSVRIQKLLSWVNFLCPANPFLKGIPWIHVIFLLVYWARAYSQTLRANLYVACET